MSDHRIRLSGLDFRLRLVAGPDDEAAATTATETAADFFLDLSEAPPGATFEAGVEIHRGDGDWILELEDGRAVTYRELPDAMRTIEHELEKAILERPSERLLLHAGSVVQNGAACAFMASADRGKTTSALHCLELGAEFLTEEVTTVEIGSFEVTPHLRSLATAPEHLVRLDEQLPLTAGRLQVLSSGEARYIPSRVHRSPAPLRTLVIPTYDRDGSDELREVSAADMLTEMLGYCFEPRQNHETFIDGLIGLLESCRIMHLRYRHGGSVRRMLEDVLQTRVDGVETGPTPTQGR